VDKKVTWLILPVVICLSQRLSHAFYLLEVHKRSPEKDILVREEHLNHGHILTWLLSCMSFGNQSTTTKFCGRSARRKENAPAVSCLSVTSLCTTVRMSLMSENVSLCATSSNCGEVLKLQLPNTYRNVGVAGVMS